MSIEIIPAIDLLDGQCVRLTRGDYATSKVYGGDPLEVARRFERMGAEWLHVVDLNGARGDGMMNLRAVERICAGTHLRVEFGGGVRRTEDAEAVFGAGVGRVCVGSVAQRDVALTKVWMERFSPGRVVIGADAREGRVCVDGWRTSTMTTVDELVRAYLPELRRVVCTDIDRDGVLGGAAVEFYRSLCRRFPTVAFTASGGVASMADIRALEAAGVAAVVVGKAFYEGVSDFNAW